jgi:WD40 repeat protein
MTAQVAVGYKDGAILVWDMVKGTCETVLKGHKGAITALAYNKSGALLASGSTDTNIIVWDAVGEAGLYSLRAHRDQVPLLILCSSVGLFDLGTDCLMSLTYKPWDSFPCSFPFCNVNTII